MSSSVLVALLMAFPSLVLAQTNAEKVFGKWEKVSIEEIKKRVPEYEFERVALGSVTNEYKPNKAAPCTLGNVVYLGGYPCRKDKDILSDY